ncbi:hypothetical protein CVT24_010728 [Panaeolus cyanescens]|uniref:Uncharacterized protein n=1 Tax=Panaeolus cyanescens TaxID=181874 RepID=A0A409X9W1_9AGAR|nr:hypothetical protein CVT24_010728 [Panaeolus cyanescens]
MIKHGVYRTEIKGFDFVDECEGLTAEETTRYYGYETDGSEQSRDSGDENAEVTDEGNDSSSDEDDLDNPDSPSSSVQQQHQSHHTNVEDEEAYLDSISKETDDNIRHPPVDVPDATCPLSGKEYRRFVKRLQAMDGKEPIGYGIREEEWNDGNYPETEDLAVGRASRVTVINLPDHIWRPRARKWTQAHYVMARILRDRR